MHNALDNGKLKIYVAIEFYALGLAHHSEHNKTVDVKLTEHDDLKRLLAEKICDPDENTQTDILMYQQRCIDNKRSLVVGRKTILF